MENLSKIIKVIKKGGTITGTLELSMLERMVDIENTDFPFLNKDSFFKFLNNNLTLLKEVKKLSLRSNQIKKIPDFVFGLPNLEILELSKNEITEIPQEIENLEELKVLDLAHNHIQELPDEILELRLLEVLRIHRNEIKRLPKKIHKLINLKELIALDNNIKEIPKSIIRLKYLDQVMLQDNPIENVSSAIYTQGNGIDAIRNYFNTSNEELSIYYGVKIIVVGDGEVGKTTIVKNLKDICAMEDHPSTVGLEIKEWDFHSDKLRKTLKFRIWDFGGQGKYRTVQQLFCTPNAIYIYVTVPNQFKQPEKYGSFKYWLNFINVLGDNSPVIFITNKIDKSNNDNFLLDESSIKESFPFIEKFIKTRFDRRKYSIKSIADIKSAIDYCITTKTKNSSFRFDKLRNDWIAVIEELNEIRKTRNFMSKKDFSKLCYEAKVYKLKEQDYLLNYLDKSGTILKYDNDNIP